jgi:hypothetical protein
MALLEVLDRHGIPYDKEEVTERLDLLIKGLKRDPEYAAAMKTFKSKKQKGGGADIPIPSPNAKSDFLGNEMRWIVSAAGSPYIQVAVRILFTFLFFLSYVESVPIFGSMLSAALDVYMAGGRILMKTIQKGLPLLTGLFPLPYTNFLGMGIAAGFGLIVWPMFAVVSFSRQDFTSAAESMIRVVPPPLGDVLADAFLDANRTVYRLNEKRVKLVDDIVGGLKQIMSVGEGLGAKVSTGATGLIDGMKKVKTEVPKETLPVGGRRHRFSRKAHKKAKWRTRRR